MRPPTPPLLPRSLESYSGPVHTIYRARPGELGPYIARRFQFGPSGPTSGSQVIGSGELGECLDAIPAEAQHLILRASDDDPSIVQSWI